MDRLIPSSAKFSESYDVQTSLIWMILFVEINEKEGFWVI
jgi:hypothetical protein